MAKTKNCGANKAVSLKQATCKLPKLGARLSEAYSQVLNLAKPGDIVADVGTDHGFLAAHLAKSGVFSRVIATDISASSLKKAEILCNSLGLSVEYACGDGLLAAPECSIAAICGMGAWEIIKILQQPNVATRFVFVAMQNPKDLREYLLKNKYIIVQDKLVSQHGKFYFVMSAIKQNGAKKQQVCADYGVNAKDLTKYGKFELFFGQKFDAKSGLGQLYLQNEINNLNFFANFDNIKALKFKHKDTWQKYKYYKLCKKLLQEGQNDPGHN